MVRAYHAAAPAGLVWTGEEPRLGMAITLWDSEEDLRASEASAEQQRQGGTKRTGLTVLGVERCQVLFDELV